MIAPHLGFVPSGRKSILSVTNIILFESKALSLLFGMCSKTSLKSRQSFLDLRLITMPLLCWHGMVESTQPMPSALGCRLGLLLVLIHRTARLGEKGCPHIQTSYHNLSNFWLWPWLRALLPFLSHVGEQTIPVNLPNTCKSAACHLLRVNNSENLFSTITRQVNRIGDANPFLRHSLPMAHCNRLRPSAQRLGCPSMLFLRC